MENLLLKLNPYKMSQTDRTWTKEYSMLKYDNKYKSVLRIDSSNKWIEIDGVKSMSKMWSIIVCIKQDFTKLQQYLELKNHLKIAVTPVSKGQLAGNYGIRIYDMKQEPDSKIIKEILDFIFKK